MSGCREVVKTPPNTAHARWACAHRAGCVETERESVTVGVVLPTLLNTFRVNAGDGTEGRSRLARWLLGIAATGFGIWGFFQVVVTHITDCGFDANGAYAKVHVFNLVAASEVWVDFYLDGRLYTYTGAYNVRGTQVLRAPFPREGHVSGRTVYVDDFSGGQVKLVTRKFAEAHPGQTHTEVVPDASHTLSCRFDYTDPD
jgi:hypothetical protein